MSEKCRDCGNRTSIGNDPIGLDGGSTIRFCLNQTCHARDAVLPGSVEQPQSSIGPEEAPPRNCPKCGAEMASRTMPKSDVGPSYYYLCRKCNYGFSTVIPNPGTPLTMEQRRLANIDSEALIKKAEKTTALHKDLFPPEGTPQIHEELKLFPYPSLEEIAEKSKPGPSTEEVLEKSKSLVKTVRQMEDDRRALEKAEYDERVKPLMQAVKMLNLKERREKARTRLIPTRYDEHGRITGIPDKTLKG
jgi:hypothetical protein